MNKKLVAMLVFTLFLFSGLPMLQVKANPTVWNVGFAPGYFPSITAALASGLVVPGDTIHVWNGVYVENPVINIPNIKIIGQGGVTVQAAAPGFCFAIFAPATGVTIMDLSIVYSPAPSLPKSVGVYLGPGVSLCKIWNNVVLGFDYGVVMDGANNNEIVGNTVDNCMTTLGIPGPVGSCSTAIYMINGATLNQVRGNEIGQTAPDWYGVGTWLASGNTITLNNFWVIMAPPPEAFVGPGDVNAWDSSANGLARGNWWTGAFPPYVIGGPNVDMFCHPAGPYTWAAYPWDMNRDGKCDMKDIGAAAKAFGTHWSMLNWNPKADINGLGGVPDGQVDMRDIGLFAKNFGWTIP